MLQVRQVESELLAFLRERREGDGLLETDTDLLGAGWIDSLLLLDMILHIQSYCGVVLSAGDVTPGNFRDIATLAQLITNKSGGASEKAA